MQATWQNIRFWFHAIILGREILKYCSYGIDIKRAGCLNMVELDVQNI
jgi:hypothetical protein